ncbi:putative zinc finger protein 286B [Photinus pyralis]|uniref:C2H2-type domain-containing protein n=1 Tax=Photinus pyralis TaxID=7054 RepID=A0A1Y1L132_PHOPY|nr:putative zinc finger protein 286B [Photinus pyralis]
MDFVLKQDFEEPTEPPAATADDMQCEVDDQSETALFLQQGQFIVPLDGHTVVLEDGQQYLVNNLGDNGCKTESPIVYYTNEEYYDEDSASQYTFIVDNGESNETEGDQVVFDSELEPICEYAILKDGKLHLQTVEMEELQASEAETADDDDVHTVDLKKITGRNLVTGQTVTLDRYFQKLQTQLSSEESAADDGGGLVNRKVTIGKTAGGKRIVGKILHFQSSESVDKMTVKNEEDAVQPLIVRKEQRILTKENCDMNIVKTLAGLMDLESVRNKMRNKKLVVKIVDKIYGSQTNDFTKTVAYVYGHMAQVNDEDWTFDVHDVNDTNSDGSSTVFVTILTTVDCQGKKSMRVNLVPSFESARCRLCAKEFKSAQQLRRHVLNSHGNHQVHTCDRCGKNFVNGSLLERHKRMLACHKLFQCSKCPKSFNSAGSLKRHITIHDPSLRPLECTVCSQRFTDESSLKKHLLIHTGIRAYTCNVCTRSFRNRGDLNFHRRIHDPVKQFCCEICGRAFSRYSNMLRHTDIHRGTGTLHRCDICGCSYSFISSLTRHIVQKHVKCQA